MTATIDLHRTNRLHHKPVSITKPSQTRQHHKANCSQPNNTASSCLAASFRMACGNCWDKAPRTSAQHPHFMQNAAPVCAHATQLRTAAQSNSAGAWPMLYCTAHAPLRQPAMHQLPTQPSPHLDLAQRTGALDPDKELYNQQHIRA
jgi:hypothetical protein